MGGEFVEDGDDVGVLRRGHFTPRRAGRLRTGHFDKLRTGMGGPPWAVIMGVVRAYRGCGLGGRGKWRGEGGERVGLTLDIVMGARH